LLEITMTLWPRSFPSGDVGASVLDSSPLMPIRHPHVPSLTCPASHQSGAVECMAELIRVHGPLQVAAAISRLYKPTLIRRARPWHHIAYNYLPIHIASGGIQSASLPGERE
jgi:hypothetical protein